MEEPEDAHSSRRPALKPIMRVNQWYEGDKFFCLPGHVSSNPFELLLDLVVVGMVHLTAEAAAIATEDGPGKVLNAAVAVRFLACFFAYGPWCRTIDHLRICAGK